MVKTGNEPAKITSSMVTGVSFLVLELLPRVASRIPMETKCVIMSWDLLLGNARIRKNVKTRRFGVQTVIEVVITAKITNVILRMDCALKDV